MKEKHLDVVRTVMGRQLLDANYVECGKVEDVELEGGVGELKVTGIFTGPGAAADQLPRFLRPLAKKVFGHSITRLPWAQVQVIGAQIKLNERADQLGLNEAEAHIAERLEKIPGAQ